MVTRTVARNVIFNWAGQGVNLLAGFLLVPFLVHRLGQTTYGVWILVASFYFYFNLLDLGICGAVGRQIAFYHAKQDREGMNSTLSTALAILTAAGLLALIGTLCAMCFLFRLFPDIPPAQHNAALIALLFVGLNLLFWLPFSAFNATLWGHQRFDLINITDFFSVSTRVALIVFFIGSPRLALALGNHSIVLTPDSFPVIGSLYSLAHAHPLVTLSLINLMTLSGGQFIKGILAFTIANRDLRISAKLSRKDAAHALFGIGFWNSMLMLANVVNGQLGCFTVGHWLTVALVTPFSIASRLMGYSRDFLVASTGILTPVAVSFHAENRHDKQQNLLVYGSKYCLTLAIFFIILLTVLGPSVIQLWMGHELQWASKLLLVIALGEALPLSQWVSFSTILGQYRHRALAIAALCESAAAIALCLILVKPYGLLGVCVGLAIPATCSRGIFQMIYACRLLKLPVHKYLTQVFVPVIGAACFPVAILFFAMQMNVPSTWPQLITYTAGFGLLLVASVALLTETEMIMRFINQRFPVLVQRFSTML